MVAPWTFALIKPDAVTNPIAIRWLLSALNCEGFIVTKGIHIDILWILRTHSGCRLQLSSDIARVLYAEHEVVNSHVPIPNTSCSKGRFLLRSTDSTYL